MPSVCCRSHFTPLHLRLNKTPHDKLEAAVNRRVSLFSNGPLASILMSKNVAAGLCKPEAFPTINRKLDTAGLPLSPRFTKFERDCQKVVV
jgi:hypothetical protein